MMTFNSKLMKTKNRRVLILSLKKGFNKEMMNFKIFFIFFSEENMGKFGKIRKDGQNTDKFQKIRAVRRNLDNSKP